MAAFTAADVKALREKTGAGMMDAKKALEGANGDIEAAVDALRAKGLATAQKKSSRTAAEGLVGVAVEGTKGVAVEVNSETDFVAKNEKFQDFVRKTTQVALGTLSDDVDALKASAYPDGGTVADKLTDNVATIGENQQVRRMKTVSVTNGVIVPYLHNAVAPDLGKIGVLVALESEGDAAKLEELGKKLAMHIAAAFPKITMHLHVGVAGRPPTYMGAALVTLDLLGHPPNIVLAPHLSVMGPGDEALLKHHPVGALFLAGAEADDEPTHQKELLVHSIILHSLNFWVCAGMPRFIEHTRYSREKKAKRAWVARLWAKGVSGHSRKRSV